ncbi:uncharacterized protein TM35_000351540 [Trypanosoma theileri]|uniref:PDZ domain-containing protein n=1 Tax=Trypanosoma theileri TaxID=67003 RepID=A0A1X0NMQ4_9TRYP|nr:uncharacterized protein TM35_000351540 [Trypanosoma theileri]ORC85410.1 hypothetical protein TM35_000351540 [Trypanosoma theileri]
MSGNNTLTVINPDDGKRYRLNIKGEVGRLTIGRLKQCLAAASSCPIPAADQIIKFNSTPLNHDDEACAAYGITNGSTLTVEHRHNVDPSTNHTASFNSPRRRALEYQTIQQQEVGLSRDTVACDDTLQRKINDLQDQLHSAERKKRELEREKEMTERELNRVREKEELAEKEKQRLAELQQLEARRAAQRASDLAARREQLRVEEEAAREVALQKLDNERRRALLEQQRAEYEAEKKRLEKEREAYEQRAKEREVNIRAREIEIEQQLLSAERDRKELALQRLVSQKNRLLYYDRMGMPPPPELQQAASMMEWNNSQPPSIQAAQFENQNHNINGHILPLGLNVSGSMQSSTLQQQQQQQQYQGKEKERPHNNRSDQYPNGFLGSEYKSPLCGSVENSGKRESFVTDNAMKVTGNDNSVLPQDVGLYDARENAIQNMLYMSQDLGLEKPLEFDDNNTCVLSVDGQYTLLVTFDTTTERLFLYSTLLTAIPRDPNVRLSVYEFLMEGALLGREMCGGGVGASLKNDFILLSTSIYLPTSHPTTLRTIIPLFVLSLQKWREKLQQLLDDVHAENKTVNANDSDVKRRLKEQSTDRSINMTATPVSAQNHNIVGAGHSGSKPFIGIEATDSVVVNGVSSKYEDGVLVISVTGPAAHAGIKPHDFITRINGKPVTSLRQFQHEVSNLVGGAVVPFVVDRAGHKLVVSTKVGLVS